MTPAEVVTPAEPPASSARDLVAALEQLPLGVEWADPFEEAVAAVGAAYGAARAPVFPPVAAPASADAVAQFRLYIELRPLDAGCASALAQLHGRVPEVVARLIRDPVIVAGMVRVASQPNVFREDDVREAMVHAALRGFERAVCGQLIAAGHALAPDARALVEVLDLEARLAPERKRREQHAAAEVERLESERQAADRILAAERAKGEAERRELERVAADLRAAAALPPEQVAAATRGVLQLAEQRRALSKIGE